MVGAIPAALLLSAESVGGIIRMKSLESITIRAPDTSDKVAGAGENFLIAAIINDKIGPVNVQSRKLSVAEKIRESM
jgi:hypothetical protein